MITANTGSPKIHDNPYSFDIRLALSAGCDRLTSIYNPDRFAWMRANLDTDPATDTPRLYRRPVEIGKLKTDRLGPKRTDGRAGAADTVIDPRIARRPIYLGDAHIDIGRGNRVERFSRADVHAFATKRAGPRHRIDVGRVRSTVVALMKQHAFRRADFAA